MPAFNRYFRCHRRVMSALWASQSPVKFISSTAFFARSAAAHAWLASSGSRKQLTLADNLQPASTSRYATLKGHSRPTQRIYIVMRLCCSFPSFAREKQGAWDPKRRPKKVRSVENGTRKLQKSRDCSRKRLARRRRGVAGGHAQSEP